MEQLAPAEASFDAKSTNGIGMTASIHNEEIFIALVK
jgi:hypothetical protein